MGYTQNPFNDENHPIRKRQIRFRNARYPLWKGKDIFRNVRKAHREGKDISGNARDPLGQGNDIFRNARDPLGKGKDILGQGEPFVHSRQHLLRGPKEIFRPECHDQRSLEIFSKGEKISSITESRLFDPEKIFSIV
jgi:hypothetical protein